MPTLEEENTRLRKELDAAHTALHAVRNELASLKMREYLRQREENMNKARYRDTDPDEVGYA